MVCTRLKFHDWMGEALSGTISEKKRGVPGRTGGESRELGTFSLENSSVSVHNVHFMVYTPLSFLESYILKVVSKRAYPKDPFLVPRGPNVKRGQTVKN